MTSAHQCDLERAMEKVTLSDGHHVLEVEEGMVKHLKGRLVVQRSMKPVCPLLISDEVEWTTGLPLVTWPRHDVTSTWSHGADRIEGYESRT